MPALTRGTSYQSIFIPEPANRAVKFYFYSVRIKSYADLKATLLFRRFDRRK